MTHEDVPLSEQDEYQAIEELYDSIVTYGRGTPRLTRMLLTAIRETLVVYQTQEIERCATLEAMLGRQPLGPPDR